MNRARRWVGASLIGCLAACSGGGGGAVPARARAVPRRTVVWLGPEGLDAALGADLQRVGVDEVVVRRGSVSLAGGVQVLRLQPSPPVAASLPVGLALVVEDAPDGLKPSVADTVWKALAGELRGERPAELLVDLPRVVVGMDGFVTRLGAVAGVPVVPVLTPDQLLEEPAMAVVAASGSCLVLLYGEVGFLRPGAEVKPASLEEQLAPLRASGVRVRVGVVLAPRTEPALAQWTEPIDPLCKNDVTTISTRSRLDRAFSFNTEVTWNGRIWRKGDRLEASWVDAARLNANLVEAGRLVMPELGGFDLVPLPSAPRSLGLGSEALVRYLGGEGPAPAVEVHPLRSGSSVRVRLDNPGPFTSAVSSLGNWVEVSVAPGTLVVEDRGSFDRLLVGTVRGREFKQGATGAPSAVRFVNSRIGAAEALETGAVRVPADQSRVTVRWQLVLSTGETVGGELEL